MKGKKAAQAANRRAAEATATVEALQNELRQARADHRKLTNELEAEIRRLKLEHLREAGVIAEREVRRQLAEKEEERRKRGMSDELAIHFMYQKDKFILNACRYISMTRGFPPMEAFELVMTWCLDNDFVGVNSPISFCMKIGVPLDGWVAWQLKKNEYFLRGHEKRTRNSGTVSAISLDRAEEEGHSDIHPRYRSYWYPRHIKYGDLIVEDDKDEAAAG